MTARERIDRLLDKGTFHEIGIFAKSRSAASYGEINGRKVYIFSQNFTSMGGTLSEIHGKKMRMK